MQPTSRCSPGHGTNSAPRTKGTEPGPVPETASLDAVQPIETVQLYQEISARLEEQVRLGNWRPGQKLPSERELARSLNVSRPSLREAIGALKVRGVLATRQGAATRVTERAPRILGRHQETPPRLEDVSPVALLEAREVLEPAAVALLAARYQKDHELDGYLEIMASGDGERFDLDAWCDADRLFHRRIAVLTGNAVLVEFADRVSSVMDQRLWRELRNEMLAVPGRVTESADEHRRILDSLRRGQSDSAAAHAREHVRAVRTYMGLDPNQEGVAEHDRD